MTMRRKLILLLSLLFLTTTATWAAQTTTKQRTPQQFKAKPDLNAPAPTGGGTPQPSPEQLAAQAWLKSIGYDLTIEQMATLKKLVLQKYSLETVKLITDENMVHVRQLPNLEILQVHRLIGDAGVAYFAGLKKLRVFNMPDSRLTDKGLAVIGGMTQLENLVIPSHPNITDASVPYLKQMTGLQRLDIQGKGITQQGFSELKLALPNTTIVYP
jgi:hypothetical protein